MVRVAKPVGRVLIWDHNPRNPYWRLLMARVPQDTGEERLIGVTELLDGLPRPAPSPCCRPARAWSPTSPPAA